MPYLLKRVINVQRVTCVTNDIRWNAAKRSGLSWGDSSIPCGIYIMPRRRRDAMGMRKLKIKKVLKNTFYRKSNGNLISQLRILIQNRAVFETLRLNNFFFSDSLFRHTHTVVRPRTSAFERCGCVGIGYRRSKIDFFHPIF